MKLKRNLPVFFSLAWFHFFSYIYTPVPFILLQYVQVIIGAYSYVQYDVTNFFSKFLPSYLSTTYYKVHFSYSDLRYHFYIILNFHMCCFYFWISPTPVLLLQPVCLFMSQYHTDLIIVTSQCALMSGKSCPSRSFCLSVFSWLFLNF